MKQRRKFDFDPVIEDYLLEQQRPRESLNKCLNRLLYEHRADHALSNPNVTENKQLLAELKENTKILREIRKTSIGIPLKQEVNVKDAEEKVLGALTKRMKIHEILRATQINPNELKAVLAQCKQIKRDGDYYERNTD